MDPDAVFADLLISIENGDDEEVMDFAETLIDWLRKGGYVPRVTRTDLITLLKQVL